MRAFTRTESAGRLPQPNFLLWLVSVGRDGRQIYSEGVCEKGKSYEALDSVWGNLFFRPAELPRRSKQIILLAASVEGSRRIAAVASLRPLAPTPLPVHSGFSG